MSFSRRNVIVAVAVIVLLVMSAVLFFFGKKISLSSLSQNAQPKTVNVLGKPTSYGFSVNETLSKPSFTGTIKNVKSEENGSLLVTLDTPGVVPQSGSSTTTLTLLPNFVSVFIQTDPQSTGSNWKSTSLPDTEKLLISGKIVTFIFENTDSSQIDNILTNENTIQKSLIIHNYEN